MAIGKIARFSAANRSTDAIGDALSHADDTGGALENVSLAKIRLDSEQPREMRLSRQDPRDIPGDAPDRARMLEELEKVQELADSIRSNGLAQPVAVYRHGDHFLLAWGERRLLAHVLLGRESIPAKILPERPRNLLALQLVENMQRKDLSLKERVRGMERLIEEAERNNIPITGADDLGRALGLGASMSYAYWAILRGPEDVRLAIDDGRLTHFREAQRIAVIKLDSDRAQALLNLDSPAPTAEMSHLVPPSTYAAPKAVRRGRPVTAASLPRIENPALIRYIVEHLCAKQELVAFTGVDWNDLSAAAQILRQVIKKIDRRLAVQGDK